DEAWPADFLGELRGQIQKLPVGGGYSMLRSVNALAQARPFREWLIPRVILKGQACGLSGPEKALKTLLVLNLCLNIAAGEGPWPGFIGRYPVCGAGRRVGIFTLEDDEAAIMAHLECMAKTDGIPWQLDSPARMNLGVGMS